MMNIPSWLIGALIALAGLGFTAAGFFFSRLKDVEKKAREDGMVITKIEGLEKKVDKINDANATQSEKCGIRGERLALVEASAKSSHLRIDGVEKRLDAMERKD